MSTPAKSFDNLRSILGKLDRKIDSARSKRLGLDLPDEADSPESLNGIQEHAEEALVARLQPVVESQPHAPRTAFGRAKPLNRNGQPAPGTWIGGGGIG
jgi:hypothetical protein